MMKKALVFLLLAAFVVPVFADDALTLPAGVMRTRIIPSMTTINQVFDADGERQDNPAGTVQVYNLSFGLEYGVNSWITPGLRWVPGWTFASSIENVDNASRNGLNDLFVGVKLQIVGEGAPVPNSAVRFAVTPGFKIPLSEFTYDAAEEGQNFADNNTYRDRIDNGTWAVGGQVSFDYIISENFYLNLFNETVVYLPSNQEQFGDHAAAAVIAALGGTPPAVEAVEVKPGTELKFELDANYTMPVGNGVRLGFGLPVTYQMTMETEVDGAGQDNASWVLSVGPSVSAFFTSWALPMEFELGYTLPIAGEKAFAANTISLQVKNFLRF